MSLNLEQFDQLARDYQGAYALLSERVTELEAQLHGVKRSRLQGIKNAVVKVRDAEAALQAAVEGNAKLFARPKTQTLHGVRFGFRKGKQTIEFDNEGKVIARIRVRLGAKAEQLINTTEKADKKALQKLDKSDLQKIGVTVVDPGDEAFIKNTASDVEKFVDGLLKEYKE